MCFSLINSTMGYEWYAAVILLLLMLMLTLLLLFRLFRYRFCRMCFFIDERARVCVCAHTITMTMPQ